MTQETISQAPAASHLVTFGIGALALVVAAGFVILQANAARRLGESPSKVALKVGTGAAIWLALTGGLAAAGVLSRWELRPPPMAPMFAAILIASVSIGFSALGTRMKDGLPLALLIGFQGFRLPLELVMHQAAETGVMPVEMSFSGYNFDIVTGTSALVVAGLVAFGRAPRWLVVAWNFLGFATLFVIALVAFASMPLLHAFGTEPAHLNTWVAYFPFIWLPASLVVAALSGHIVIARQLTSVRTPTLSLQPSHTHRA